MKTYIFKGDRPNSDFEIEAMSVSDGYHTFDELYEHRNRLFLALVKMYDNYLTPLRCEVKCWKSKLHDDGTMFEDFFILGMTITKPNPVFGGTPLKWDITYHLPIKYWNMANVIALEKAPPWDGHTSQDVLERLLML